MLHSPSARLVDVRNEFRATKSSLGMQQARGAHSHSQLVQWSVTATWPTGSFTSTTVAHSGSIGAPCKMFGVKPLCFLVLCSQTLALRGVSIDGTACQGYTFHMSGGASGGASGMCCCDHRLQAAGSIKCETHTPGGPPASPGGCLRNCSRIPQQRGLLVVTRQKPVGVQAAVGHLSGGSMSTAHRNARAEAPAATPDRRRDRAGTGRPGRWGPPAGSWAPGLCTPRLWARRG